MGRRSKGVTLIELTVVLGILAIISGTVMISGVHRQTSALQNASYALQADLRFAQRRAIQAGTRHAVLFDIQGNQYHIIQLAPRETLRTVQLPEGVRIMGTSAPQLAFLPRGTASAGFSVTLTNGIYTQRLTATVSGGRIRIFDMERL